ncbi:MAG: metallophosphoesterase [Planctomycetota bacterium]|jgi:histidinol phosphatase-like PHP family hydrolase/calcineurin-like phosphoesterase family protein
MNQPPLPKSPICIAVLTDLHFGDSPLKARRSDIADILLQRAVYRLNRLVRPDVVLVLGDLVEDGDRDGADEYYARIKAILDTLDCPMLILPGNHDGTGERFYQRFPRPKAIEEIAGVRFLSFADQQEPGFNASRSDADLAVFKEARSGFDGPLVSLQHVCLLPPEKNNTPYTYLNADAVVEAMTEARVCLSVSGHHHAGAQTVVEHGCSFVTAPGLCERPFPFAVLTLGPDGVSEEQQKLVMPRELGLIDHHVHTHLAYCSEDMTVPRAVELAEEFGLAGLSFAEHSGHLYLDPQEYGSQAWLDRGLGMARPEASRMAEYLTLKRQHESKTTRFGLELDCNAQGAPLLTEEDRAHFNTFVGAVHALPGLTRETPPTEEHCASFLAMLDGLLAQGIKLLAHPLRVFRRAGWVAPEDLFLPTAERLAKSGVAAEINFHTNEPPLPFIQACLEQGVKFAFGSDAHNLAEIGEFGPHLALLREAGFSGDPKDILLRN